MFPYYRGENAALWGEWCGLSVKKRTPTQEDVELAWTTCRENRGIMYKTALNYLSDPRWKDDVFHDAVVRLAEHADRLRAANSAQRAVYAVGVVRSVALNFERRLSTEGRLFRSGDVGELFAGVSTPGPEEALAERDFRDRRLTYLRQALEELDAEERSLLVEKYLLGTDDETLARRLGIKPASVRMKLTRARRQLRRLIERKEGGHGK